MHVGAALAKAATKGQPRVAPADAAKERLRSSSDDSRGEALLTSSERRDPHKRRMHLDSLLEHVSDANRHREVETGGPVGEEAW